MTFRMYGSEYPEPSPPVIEVREDGRLCFGLKIKPRYIDSTIQQTMTGVFKPDEVRWVPVERLIEEEAVAALEWGVENRRGDLVMHKQEPSDYLLIHFRDDRDTTLFKLHWIG